MERFKLVSDFKPTGDQGPAIDKLAKGVLQGKRFQTLLGITGSGKTFTIANVIARVNKPTLVISHNKTLAAQLYNEFKTLFPENEVGYFVSYYDYYQPEAYIPHQDKYIGKETTINEEIDRLRLRATSALASRRDVIIVASVSCIYGLGDPGQYGKMAVHARVGDVMDRDVLLEKLVAIQYSRNDIALDRGCFRARGDVVDVLPAYADDIVRFEFFGDHIESISRVHVLSGKTLEKIEDAWVYPARHFVTDEEGVKRALKTIREELDERLAQLKEEGKVLEAARLKQRAGFDLEMIKNLGYCPGIENYSRHFDKRASGQAPFTLIDYFGHDFLIVIDESHVTIPQIKGMHHGDSARKKNLVDYGFRLPSAYDNRPLRFEEFEQRVKQAIFVSATPDEFEKGKGDVVEQIIRPTGLLDPTVEVRPTKGQLDDLLQRIHARVKKDQRILVTTLTTKMAENLTEFLSEKGVKVQYLHHEIDTIQRSRIVRDLRLGTFDCVVGVNLLREGLDMPEVSLVAILDADAQGFLRSETSLIQTIGRAARNADGAVIMYADRVSDAMKRAIQVTTDRRKRQEEYNKVHGIVPRTIVKKVSPALLTEDEEITIDTKQLQKASKGEVELLVEELTARMDEAAEKLEFERAAKLRDQISQLKLLERLKRA